MVLIRFLLLALLWLAATLGPATRRAIEGYGAAVEAVTPRKRREEPGTVVAVTRADNQRIVSAQVRVGDQVVTVPWTGAGAAVGDAVVLTRALGSAAVPDWQFLRFEASSRPYPLADDDADIPPPSFVTPFTTTVMLTATAQQGAQVTVHLTETPAAYGPQSIEVRWRRTSGDANWRHLVIADQAGVDAAIAAVLPELLEPGTSYDFQARTTTVGGAVSPYGATMTRLLDPAVPVPSQPPPFQPPPTIPYLDTSGNAELVIHYPPPSQPTLYDYWQTEIASASGGPAIATLTHYGAIGNWKPAAPGTFYVRYREVSKYSSGGSRVTSAWQPGTGFAGPITLVAAPGFDTTPPNVPTDLAVPFNGYVTTGGQTIQLTRFQWNGEDGVPSTYAYSTDFDSFELWAENQTNAADSFFVRTARKAVYTAYGALRPGHTYRMQVRAWDTRGNATGWVVGPSVTVPLPTAPPGPTSIAIERMGYNAAAFRISYTPPDATSSPCIGFHVYSAPNGYPASETFRGFFPTTGVGGGTILNLLVVINPVTSDPLPNPPNVSGTLAMVGTQWAFRAVPVSANGDLGATSAWAIGTFTAVDGANLIVNSVHADKITAGTITADRLTAALAFISQYIRLQSGAAVRSNLDEVILNETGLHATGAKINWYAGPAALANWRATIEGRTGPRAYGTAPTGLMIRTTDGVLSGQNDVATGQGWILEPYALTLYNATGQFASTTGYDTKYAYDGIYDAGVRRGTHYRLNAPSAAFGALTANTDYVAAYTSFAGLPAGCTAWVVRGYVNAAAGTRFYVYGATMSLEAGGSILVPAGATSVDWGPWVVPVAHGQNNLWFRATAAATGGTFYVVGYFR